MLRDAPPGSDLVPLLEHLADQAESRNSAAYDHIAGLARALAAELAALRPEDESAAARARHAISGALQAAHQPLREAVLFERARDRGMDLSPEAFQLLAEDLVTRGEIRMAVEHDPPPRERAPFQPRFYRPSE